jgi:hypothetical protein
MAVRKIKRKEAKPGYKIGYLCSYCAEKKLGWKWPRGHLATMSMGICDVCGKGRVLTCEDDWLRPGEDKMPVERWD